MKRVELQLRGRGADCIERRFPGLELREVAPGWTPDEVQQRTEARLIVRGRIPEMKLA